MANSTNASPVEAAFHFQDIAALYLFLKNINEVKSFEVEGEEDIGLTWNDGKKSFIQAKETANPYSTFNITYVKDALAVLSKDINENPIKNVKSVAFMTNSHFPFGKKTGHDFNNLPYIFWDFDALPLAVQNKIVKLMSSKKEYQLDTGLLRIIKMEYTGSDDDSKLSLLKQEIVEFMDSASITPGKYRTLLSNWLFMVSRSSEDPKKVITKEQVAGYTSIIYLDDETRIETFFELFDVLPGNEEYIRGQYSKYLDSLTVDMSIINKINGLIVDYKSHHKISKHRKEIMVDFVNENYPKIASELGMSTQKERDADVAKFIMWLIIVNKANFNSIEEALA